MDTCAVTFEVFLDSWSVVLMRVTSENERDLVVAVCANEGLFLLLSCSDISMDAIFIPLG